MSESPAKPPNDDDGQSTESIPLVAYRITDSAPEIIVASPDRRWMDLTHDHFAYRCLPLRIANQSGWWILNSEPFEAVWHGGVRVEDITVRPFGSRPELAPKSHFGFGVLTWHIPYLFRTPPGLNLAVGGPVNWVKEGAQALEGIVETDWATATFTMNWKLTRPGFPVRFAAGEPICMIAPRRRYELERVVPETRDISEQPELRAKHLEWSNSRRDFMRSVKDCKELPASQSWQKHYFHGWAPSGDLAKEHQVKVSLRNFSQATPAMEPVLDDAPSAGTSAGTTGSSPVTSHYLVSGDFDPDAERMRARFDDHFSHPFERRGKAQEIWDYWFVPDQYIYLRSDPINVLGADVVASFVERLSEWSLRTLGLPFVTHPFLSLYVSGCGQNLHNDSENGRLAYVYSLTRWNQRRFSGGETLILKPDDYWHSGRSLKAGAGEAMLETIPAEFNQLLVFDDRLIHGVRTVQGSMAPLEGRIVMHGHLQEGVHVDGPLTAEQINTYMIELADAITEVVSAEIENLSGFATLRFAVSPTGEASDARVLLNRLSASASNNLVGRVLELTLRTIESASFPASPESSLVTLPLVIG